MSGIDSTSRDRIRVLIVDDHEVVRQGLRTFLELHDDPGGPMIEVVGEAANGVEAVELSESLQPDIVLLDLVMPEMDGIKATTKIIERAPQTRVIILTSFGEEDKVVPAIRAGAQGYLLKDISPDGLAQAIYDAYRGEVQLHPKAAQKLMSAVSKPGETSSSQPGRRGLDDLTSREQDVMQLIADGKTNQEIADELVISESTVKTHVSNILSKLHLKDRTQIAIYALKHGVLNDED
jgi:NarL family two-component system response regulator LiaR